MRLQRLSYVTLWTTEFEETEKIYREILGLPVLERNPNFIMFDTKSTNLAFHRLEKAHKLDRQTVELHFEVNDVDEVYRSLQERGIHFQERPSNKPWGTRAASFHGPDGYVVEIIGPLK